MSTFLQSAIKRENTGRTIRSQGMFDSFPDGVKEQLIGSARLKKFADGQIVQHSGDDLNGFWVISKGQIKLGRYDSNGDMRVLVILGQGDSFGELACLGGYPRVLDGVSIGESELLWVSEAQFLQLLKSSPDINLAITRMLAVQLQESLDYLVVHSKLPAALRLTRTLLILCEGRQMPAVIAMRQQEMAELVGVSRMSIAKTLSILANEGLLTRGYGEVVIQDTAALKKWMKLKQSGFEA
jgi:CRP/FNR family transcriptional regulator, cyclic AMP receptor protein